MTDPDLLAVRRLATDPQDQSVTRSWYRITQLTAQRSRPRRLRWLAAIAGAFAVVAAVAVVKVGPGTIWPVASTSDTIALLDALAAAAQGGEAPPTPTAGQLVHVKTEGWAGVLTPDGAGVLAPHPREIWYDPQGAIPVKILVDREERAYPEKDANEQAQIAEQRLRFQTQGPSLSMPSQQWLNGLPTDPGELLSYLRVQVGRHDRWTVDHRLWEALADLYHSSELLMAPGVRANLLRAYRGMSGLSLRHITISGADLVVVRQTDGDHGNEIIFDPRSGRAVGRGSAYLGDDLRVPRPPDGQGLEPGVVYEATWQQSLVDGI